MHWKVDKLVELVKFSGLTIFKFLSARTSPNFSHFPCQVKRALLFDFALERDPKNYFYYQRHVENYTDQVLNFLLFDRHGIFRSVILVGILMFRVYVTFSLFFKIWLKESILISTEWLTSYWLLKHHVLSWN